MPVWAQILIGILGAGGLVTSVVMYILMRRVHQANAALTEANARKSDAETAQVKVKTKLEFDDAQIEKLTETVETVTGLLDRAQKQSKEIEELQSTAAKLLRELEREKTENESKQVIIDYQRRENEALRVTIVRMGQDQNGLQAQVDDLSKRNSVLGAEMKGIRDQLAECLRHHEDCLKHRAGGAA